MADSQATSHLAAQWQLISGTDISTEQSPELAQVQNAEFKELFESTFAQHVIGADATEADLIDLIADLDYSKFLTQRLTSQHSEVATEEKAQWLLRLICVGVGALRAFLQSNVTGPPLPFKPLDVLFPRLVREDSELLSKLQATFIPSLSVDGESAYHLTPNAVLLVIATTILNSPLFEGEQAPETAIWWRLRVNFFHQRTLTEKTGTLYKRVSEDIEIIAPIVATKDSISQGMFKVERAMVDAYFGNDAKALKELEEAAASTGMKYALTGVLGKRTKFQQQDLSQLVVLAKSAGAAGETAKPYTVDLNDDTLLESISFTTPDATEIQEESNLPAELQALDPADQPPLHPLDATILLLFTETIKNTNPEDGITREQMMPYAERVLSHSTNWQVYTLGLLVRSRIEGSRSRTMERGLLQLQAVVDQVIAETSGDDTTTDATTFLPRPKESESAPVRERLLYIHQLPIPTRWELEAELASLWVHLGGLKTALEIYERLELWPEVALCWAAIEREDRAKRIIRGQLFESADSTTERVPPPPQAPRLWCILGDIEQDITHYTRAWDVSDGHYARAQRSLGLHFVKQNDWEAAAEAYSKSLSIYPLHGPSWFSLGCCHLELQRWEAAVRAFGRTINIDDTDAEAWSNLATALLRREAAPQDAAYKPAELRLDDEEDDVTSVAAADPQKNKKDALRAFQRAANLKRESWRIWDNYLTVALSLSPPSFPDIVLAMQQLIKLRKSQRGELAVDADVLELLVRHIISEDMAKDVPEGYNPAKRGLTKQIVELVEKEVVPLITQDDRLWRIVARLELWRKKPRSALDANEKAWRAVSSRVAIYETEQGWRDVVESTQELVDAYESLGPMERTDGLGAGELVAKDWRFKARSVVRGVMGKGRENWSETEGYARLQEAMEGLKA